MLIKNATKKTLLAENAKLCKTIFSKSLGLMFSKKICPLVFVFDKEKIIPLHMLFVFYPIEVLFLDKNKIVVEMKKNFSPFSFYTPKNKSMFVIELPQGAIDKTKAEVGDKINF